MVWIWIRMFRSYLKWFEFGFECFESFSNGSHLHSNASNLFRVVWIRIRIPFEWFEFGIKCFESLSNGWFKFEFECFKSLRSGLNLDSNASNPFRIVRICIRMLRFPLEWFECLSSLDLNASNAFRVVRIWIRMLRIPSSCSNLHSIIELVQIWIWMLWIPFEIP